MLYKSTIQYTKTVEINIEAENKEQAETLINYVISNYSLHDLQYNHSDVNIELQNSFATNNDNKDNYPISFVETSTHIHNLIKTEPLEKK